MSIHLVYTRMLLRQTSAISILRPVPRGQYQSILHSLRTPQSRTLTPRFYSSNPTPLQTAPLRRRRIVRVLTLASILLALTGTAFLVSAYPALPFLSAPTTDAGSLALYTPPTPYAADINNHLTNNPLALTLRANPSFVESRPHMKIPPASRVHNLTGGTLATASTIPVPPLTFAEEGGKSAVVLYYLGKDICGHPGVVHGGLLATILDEGMARCCFPALPQKVGMTASLKVEYKRPVPAEGYVLLKAWTRKVEGRKAWVEARVERLMDGEGEGEVYCTAEALFIEPRQAKTMARLYPAAAA